MEHFTRATFRFLRDLAQHNDKHWFHAHKQEYENHVRGPALALVPAWLDRLPDDYTGRASKQGGAVSPPHRDVRFARDKTPYRTHLAIRLRHRLALPGAPGPTFLLWVAPSGSFLSAGVRNASGEVRRRIVQRIVEEPDAWLRARGDLPLSDEAMLQMVPPGAPESVREDLRRRHFTSEVGLSQRALTAPDLVDHLAEASARLLPLNQFLAGALYGP